MKMGRRQPLIAAILLTVLVGNVVAYTATGPTLNIVRGGSSGQVVTSLTPIGESFSVARGAASVTAGVELYKIELGSAQWSNLLRINMALLNPDEMGQVLNNPNSYILVQVYYPGTGADQVTLDYDGTVVIPDTGDDARAMMSRQYGTVLLRPSITGQSTIYVLASIMVPAGPPPGQQAQLNDLKFWIDIRMNSS